jgi:hypothetical protein
VPLCGSGENDIDTTNMEVVHSNMGGLGPDFKKPKELRYSKVVSNFFEDPAKPGTPFSFQLVMTNLSAYDLDKPQMNGMSGAFGNFGISSGFTRFRIDLVANEDNDPITVGIKNPFFTFFDFDHKERNNQNTNATCGEVIELPGDQYIKVHGQTTDSMYVYTGQSVTGSNGDVFASSLKFGSIKDNPTDPTKLTADQYNKAIGAEAKSLSFEFELGIANLAKARTGVVDTSGCAPMNRWFQLAGYSAAKTCN